MIVGTTVTTSMPFYRLVPVNNPTFIFTCSLRICSQDSAPDYMWRNPEAVKRACSLRADLSTVPVSRFRIKTNSRGQAFYRVDFKLAIKIQDEVCTPCARWVIAELTRIGVVF